MALTTTDISKLFTAYMPGYTCEATVSQDGSLTLQFTNVANLEVTTLAGFTAAELSSAPHIKRISKLIFEELVVAMAIRATPGLSGTKH